MRGHVNFADMDKGMLICLYCRGSTGAMGETAPITLAITGAVPQYRIQTFTIKITEFIRTCKCLIMDINYSN